jgi:hypothetical protein
MSWKFFSLLNVAFVLTTIVGPFSSSHHGVAGLIALALSVPAAGGVVLYAFDRPASPSLWGVFSWLFAADSLGIFGYFALRMVEIGPRGGPLAVAVVLTAVGVYQYCVWLALHRLAEGEARPRPSASRGRDDRSSLIMAAAKNDPERARIIAWCLLAALVIAAPLAVWHTVATGHANRLIAPVVLGLIGGLRYYGSAKKLREGR